MAPSALSIACLKSKLFSALVCCLAILPSFYKNKRNISKGLQTSLKIVFPLGVGHQLKTLISIWLLIQFKALAIPPSPDCGGHICVAMLGLQCPPTAFKSLPNQMSFTSSNNCFVNTGWDKFIPSTFSTKLNCSYAF